MRNLKLKRDFKSKWYALMLLSVPAKTWNNLLVDRVFPPEIRCCEPTYVQDMAFFIAVKFIFWFSGIWHCIFWLMNSSVSEEHSASTFTFYRHNCTIYLRLRSPSNRNNQTIYSHINLGDVVSIFLWYIGIHPADICVTIQKTADPNVQHILNTAWCNLIWLVAQIDAKSITFRHVSILCSLRNERQSYGRKMEWNQDLRVPYINATRGKYIIYNRVNV